MIVCERQVRFNKCEVLTTLAGRRTMFRRIVKPHPDSGYSYCRVKRVGKWFHIEADAPQPVMHTVVCPYGQPGDRLWVRETWTYGDSDGESFAEVIFRSDGSKVRYSVSDKVAAHHLTKLRHLEACGNGENWRSSIHMPRWASRLTLEIASVRVERLQDISEADALAEGIELPPLYADEPVPSQDYAKKDFSYLWESINGAGSWDANPWVWVIEFKVVSVKEVVKR